MNQVTNVLVVDDEPRIVRTLVRLLKPFYNVFQASSALEAMDIMRNNQVHVIVSDQRMPEMTGVELLSKVKDMSKNTIRILLTGYSDLKAVMKSVNEGEIFRYITKPWNNQELLSLLEQASGIAQSLFAFKPMPDFISRVQTVEKKSTILSLSDQSNLTRNLQGLVGRNSTIVSVDSPMDAMDYLTHSEVNVIVLDIGDSITERSSFIKVAKAKFPHILSIVIANKGDSSQLIELINEGQVYRYLTKSHSLGQLKLYLMSSLRYQRKLQEIPILTQQYQVEEIKDQTARKISRALFSRFFSFFRRNEMRFLSKAV
ncbi:MAG: response regulator [Reinekea sp.]|jgi:DNA-binding NtrC family response regulator